MNVAVMGDIIGSETEVDRARLHRLFNHAVERSNAAFKADLQSPLTITLGDEFQGLMRSMESAITLIADMRLSLLNQSVECRFVIGLVELSSPVNESQAWNMMGEGLAETRDRLNRKSPYTAYGFRLDGPGSEPLERLMEGVGRALTRTERGWTDRQRAVVLSLLSEARTVEQTARRLGVTPRTIYKVRDAAGLEAYRSWWDDLTFVSRTLDEERSG